MPATNNPVIWLALASAFVWLCLGAYLTFLAYKQRDLKRRCRQLEILIHERDS